MNVRGQQHFLLSPLDYQPARADETAGYGRSPFTCLWLARLDLLFINSSQQNIARNSS